MQPGFDESVIRYEEFLAKNSFPSKVVWVTPEDVLASSKPVVYVRMPVSEENERLAKRLFDFGISQEKGVLFETLCESNDLTFAYAWVPRDELESEEFQMPKGLKLSARLGSSRMPAKLVGNRLHWTYLQLRYRGQQRLKEKLFR
jgi:hypothetical protein